MSVTIASYGAAGEVTGSRHVVTFNGGKILLDCGMFQGPREKVGDRNEELGFDPNEIDAVVLSHGHLDHCGSLPTLLLKGYKGKIYGTAATRDVARLIMEDSADIQAEDAKWKNKHWRDGEDHEPIYTRDDVTAVVNNFEAQDLGQPVKIHPMITLRLFEAGHILGSSLIHLTIEDGDETLRIGYTGDLGQKNLPILNPPVVLPETDVLITESTYGGRNHETTDQREQKLIDCVKETVSKNGKIIVPAFALGRLQTLVYSMHQLIDEGKVPRLPIYVDSPLGAELTDVFISYPDLYDEETRQLFTDKGDEPFGFRDLTYIKSVEESKELNNISGPAMIISSSGMMEAGRVIHHLRHTITDPNNTILIVGYMAEGTLGRQILEGEKRIKIFKDWFNVKAKIEHINAFSAHADETELIEFISSTPELKKIILVHGEDNARQSLADKIKGDKEVIMPEFGVEIKLA